MKQKIRKFKAEEDEADKVEPEKPQEIGKRDIEFVKEELRMVKTQHDGCCRKIEGQKNKVRDMKTHKTIYD